MITTFLPITQFTQAVAGDRIEVTQLIPLSAGPHHYQARPEEIQNLAGADVLVQNGLEMEIFLEDMIANANNANLVIIDSSEGIATIATTDLEDTQAENEPHNHHQHEHSPQLRTRQSTTMVNLAPTPGWILNAPSNRRQIFEMV